MSRTRELFTGELRERITFEERLVIGRTASGDEQIQWTPRGTVWAKAEEDSSRESHSAEQIQGELSATFIIRNQDFPIDDTMRVAWRGSYYDIKAPIAIDPMRSLFEIPAIRRPVERTT